MVVAFVMRQNFNSEQLKLSPFLSIRRVPFATQALSLGQVLSRRILALDYLPAFTGGFTSSGQLESSFLFSFLAGEGGEVGEFNYFY